MPLIMRAPHIVTSIGKRAMVLAELVDVMPTVIELAGACESNRLGVESPWSQSTSECQQFGHPPRLNNWPF
eukprot:COSAG01_NODE_181_length_22873_cov_12.951392_8_plen_71_part_00